MACHRSSTNSNFNKKPSNTARSMQPDLMVQIPKPIVAPIDSQKKQKVQVNFYVGDIRSCSDSNEMVDYIIRWLVEDSIRYQKLSAELLKNSVRPPFIQLLIDRQEFVIPWQGIVLTYKSLMSKISLG